MLLKNLNRLSIVAYLALMTMPSLAADKIGTVVAVVGSPSANGPSGNRTLSKNSEVFENDTISVVAGNAQIILIDGTRLVVGPSSKMLLDEFVMRGKSKADRVVIKGLRGTYRFMTGRSDKSAYKISTAHGTLGIRGTAFDFWSRDKTGAAVLRGKMNLRARSGADIDIGSGCQYGEATLGAAQLLGSAAKAAAIKKNLPFIVNQSSLSSRFRLNVVSCRIGAPNNDEDGNARPQPRGRLQ